MRHLWLAAMTTITCVLSAIATAQTPTAVTLRFDFFYNDIKIANTTDTFMPAADGTYTLRSHAASVGLAKLLHGDVNRESQGRLDEIHGLQMHRYSETRGKKKPQSAVFNEVTDTLLLQRGDDNREEQTEAPLFDYLTALYRSYVLGRVVDGKTPTTNGWRLKTYNYTAGTAEDVQTGAGTMQAVPLRRHSERGERILWLAPALNFLPVRLHIDDKGHVFKLVLVGYSGINIDG